MQRRNCGTPPAIKLKPLPQSDPPIKCQCDGFPIKREAVGLGFLFLKDTPFVPRSPLVAVRLDTTLIADLDLAVEARGEKASRSSVIAEALRKLLKSKAPQLKRGRPAAKEVQE